MTNERPSSNLNDITIESRFIEKLADQCQDTVMEAMESALKSGLIIDPDYPDHAEDEIVDDYRDARDFKVMAMVACSMLGISLDDLATMRREGV